MGAAKFKSHSEWSGRPGVLNDQKKRQQKLKASVVVIGYLFILNMSK